MCRSSKRVFRHGSFFVVLKQQIMKRMSFLFRLMIMMKQMFLVLCLCAVGCGGAQAQGWAVVERDSVSVAVDGGSWSGGWSPALQGTVLWLRAAEAGSGGVPVWYHGIPARVPVAAVSVFRWSAVPPEALCHTYDLKACYGGKESVARVDFVPFDSLLLMRLRWVETGRETDYYELGLDSACMWSSREWSGTMPSGKEALWDFVPALKSVREFRYDADKRAFYDGSDFYMVEVPEVPPKDFLVFSPVFRWVERSVARMAAETGVDRPEFPGGLQALAGFMQEQLQTVSIDVEAGMAGEVDVQFVVEKDGSVSQIRVVRTPHPLLAQYVRSALWSMPKWRPAMRGGQPVRTKLTLPVKF